MPARGGEHLWPIQVHAAQIAPGVWRAQGAFIHHDARLRRPLLVGADAVVRAGATIGPLAIIGNRAVVDAGTTVVEATVGENTLVGEGLALRRCSAEGRQLVDLDGDRGVAIDDPLILDVREPARSAPTRWLALALLGLLSPLTAVVQGLRACGLSIAMPTLISRLREVKRGRRAWVGVNAGRSAPSAHLELSMEAATAPTGLIDIGLALFAGESDTTERLRLLAWYAEAKCARVDAQLLWRLARGPRLRMGLSASGATMSGVGRA